MEPIRQVSARQIALLAGFAGAMAVTLLVMQEQNQAHAGHGANHQLLREIQGKPGAEAVPAPARGEERHRH